MKRVLILSSYCYEKPFTNGICAIGLNNALLDAGAQTCMIGYGDQTTILGQSLPYTELRVMHHDNAQPVRSGIMAKLGGIISFAKEIISPAYDKKTVEEYCTLILKLFELQGFEAIVAMLLPLEFTEVARRVKKNLPQVKFFIYELDSVTDGIHSSGLAARLRLAACRRFMVRQYKEADCVLHMDAHIKHAERLYPAFLDKFDVTDLPVLTAHDSFESGNGNKEETDFFYTGILDSTYRSPDRLLRIFTRTADNAGWRLHFYSKGDCEEKINAASQYDSRIIRHGYVSSRELETATEDADFFISIGNANSNSVPSKLIYYISYGRPIIHISLQENDICAEYLSRYPLALIIGVDEPEDVSRGRMLSFVAASHGKRIRFEAIKEEYRMNTPEYSAKLILRRME